MMTDRQRSDLARYEAALHGMLAGGRPRPAAEPPEGFLVVAESHTAAQGTDAQHVPDRAAAWARAMSYMVAAFRGEAFSLLDTQGSFEVSVSAGTWRAGDESRDGAGFDAGADRVEHPSVVLSIASERWEEAYDGADDAGA